MEHRANRRERKLERLLTWGGNGGYATIVFWIIGAVFAYVGAVVLVQAVAAL